MPISVDIPNCSDKTLFGRIFARLEEIDARFSTFKPDSEVSQYASGQLDEAELSPELNEVVLACRAAEKATGGYFSAWYAGQFDPSGYVKGWAIDEAGKVVEKQRYRTYCISAGGDILARSSGTKEWKIGIQDPADKSKILNVLSISNGAVCTSGNYERGAHIFDPKTGKPAASWASITVYGPQIITADVLATAAFASGAENPTFMKEYPEYKIIRYRCKN